MFILGATLKKLGWRPSLIVGVLGHAAQASRSTPISRKHPGLIVLVQLLHEHFATRSSLRPLASLWDAYFPKDDPGQAKAQGLFNVMILGVGALVANSICPYMMQKMFVTPAGGTDFHTLFLKVPYAASRITAALALARCSSIHTPAQAGTICAQMS